MATHILRVSTPAESPQASAKAAERRVRQVARKAFGDLSEVEVQWCAAKTQRLVQSLRNRRPSSTQREIESIAWELVKVAYLGIYPPGYAEFKARAEAAELAYGRLPLAH